MTVDKIQFAEKLKDIFEKNKLCEFICFTDKFHALTERMLTVNEYMNLTAIKDVDGVILKHYADSLYISKYLDKGARIIDIGCGAGFPSLVLAIARDDLSIVALDSTAKRINYITETAEMLGLTNIKAISARAEELASTEMRESFDYATARAVARMNLLNELCIPYVKVGGKFIAMKANAEDELDEAKRGISILGGEFVKAEKYSLTDGENVEPRTLIHINKVKKTDVKYPRNNSQMKKKPL